MNAAAQLKQSAQAVGLVSRAHGFRGMNAAAQLKPDDVPKKFRRLCRFRGMNAAAQLKPVGPEPRISDKAEVSAA